MSDPHAPPPDRPLIIGLAGGIGAGKSAAASCFEELGCMVIDSDARAREALERPTVRETLVQWWGEGVLDESGRVDRSRVARIVFADEGERARLEGLVHPLLAVERERTIEKAASAGIPAVVIDAPLLFEAGLDRACDATVFVDAPREVRLERVKTGRGWAADELDRREKTQMPLEKKRRLADYVVENAAGRDDLFRSVRGVFREILSHAGRRGVE